MAYPEPVETGCSKLTRCDCTTEMVSQGAPVDILVDQHHLHPWYSAISYKIYKMLVVDSGQNVDFVEELCLPLARFFIEDLHCNFSAIRQPAVVHGAEASSPDHLLVVGRCSNDLVGREFSGTCGHRLTTISTAN